MQTNPDCVHHWAIEAGGQPYSVGVCKLCGETREFENFIVRDDTGYSWTNMAAQAWKAQYGTDKPSP